MKLLWNFIYNDIRKNKIMSVVLTLFLLLSVLMVHWENCGQRIMERLLNILLLKRMILQASLTSW